MKTHIFFSIFPAVSYDIRYSLAGPSALATGFDGCDPVTPDMLADPAALANPAPGGRYIEIKVVDTNDLFGYGVVYFAMKVLSAKWTQNHSERHPKHSHYSYICVFIFFRNVYFSLQKISKGQFP